MISLALVLAPLVAGAGGSEAPIRVDGVSISAEAISRRALEFRARAGALDAERFVDALVDEAVLATEARKLGIDRDPAARPALDQAAATVLTDALVRETLQKAAAPTEAELRAMYHQGADGVRLTMVVVATREEAAAVRARLEAGGEFALESARSLDPRTARNRGDTGMLSRMQLAPAMAKEAFEAPIGQLIGPVELPLGFAVAEVVQRSVADEAGFAARRAELDAYARQRGASAARKHLGERLRTKHAATVDVKFLESLGQRVSATPAEQDRPIAFIGPSETLPYRLLEPRVRAIVGGREGSHMSGPGLKIQLAWTLVEERLLARSAREAGLAKDPRVAMDLASAEIQILAALLADRVRLAEPANATPEDREKAVARRAQALRAGMSIRVDRKAALAAAGARG